MLPRHLRQVLTSVHEEVRAIEARIAGLERELRALADADPVVIRLRTIPGIGLLTATALVGTVGHIHAFRRARQFASWLGLTPREYSSGQRRRLGGISKRGDVYLRCLLTHGARAVLASAHRRRAAQQPLTRLHHWAMTVHARRGYNKATIAVANNSADSFGRFGTRMCPAHCRTRRNPSDTSTRDAERVTLTWPFGLTDTASGR